MLLYTKNNLCSSKHWREKGLLTSCGFGRCCMKCTGWVHNVLPLLLKPQTFLQWPFCMSLISMEVFPSKFLLLKNDSSPDYFLQETGEDICSGRRRSLCGKEHILPHEIRTRNTNPIARASLVLLHTLNVQSAAFCQSTWFMKGGWLCTDASVQLGCAAWVAHLKNGDDTHG